MALGGETELKSPIGINKFHLKRLPKVKNVNEAPPLEIFYEHPRNEIFHRAHFSLNILPLSNSKILKNMNHRYNQE